MTLVNVDLGGLLPDASKRKATLLHGQAAETGHESLFDGVKQRAGN